MDYSIQKHWRSYQEVSWIKANVGEQYRKVGYDASSWPGTPPEVLEDASIRGLLWIAVSGDRAVGYVRAERHYPYLHIEDLNVLPEFQGYGIGKALLGELIDEARRSRSPLISIRTFLTTPWSVGLCKRRGFKIIGEAERPEFLKAHLDSEERSGLPLAHRCTMVLNLQESSRPYEVTRGEPLQPFASYPAAQIFQSTIQRG